MIDKTMSCMTLPLLMIDDKTISFYNSATAQGLSN